MIIWLTGMSGAGKTTIGKELYKKLAETYPSFIFLDGDIVREIMGNDLGYSVKDRKINADRISRLCHFLDSQGISAVCATQSLFHESQAWNREHIKDYFEIYIKVSTDTLFKRDPKGLYSRALKGEIKNVVGVDIKCPPPKQPDMIIENEKHIDSFDAIVREIIKKLPLQGVLIS